MWMLVPHNIEERNRRKKHNNTKLCQRETCPIYRGMIDAYETIMCYYN